MAERLGNQMDAQSSLPATPQAVTESPSTDDSIGSSRSTVAAEPTLATPWARYWARMLDTLLWSTLLGFAVGLSAPDLFNFERDLPLLTRSQVEGFIFLPFAMVFDALVSANFPNTPGKWLCGIEVRGLANERLPLATYLRRNVGLYLSGLAIGIGIIALFTLTDAYRAVKKGNLTSWDEAVGSRVYYVRGGALRTSATAFVYLLVLGGLLALAASASKTPEEQLQAIAAAVKPTMIDKVTRLDSATTEPGRVLNFNYTLVVVSADALDKGTVNSKLQGSPRKGAVQSFCNSWALRGLRVLDPTVRHRYFDKNGQLLGTIEVTKQDCSQASQ